MAIASLLLASVGCSVPRESASPAGSAAGAGGAAESVHMSVIRSSLFTAIHGIAESLGSYKKHGLSMDISYLGSGQETISVQQVIQGTVDMTLTSPPSVAALDSSYVVKGEPAPLKIIAAGTSTSNLVLAPKIKFNGLNSLHGLKIAVSSPTSGHRLHFDYFLKEHGTSSSKIGFTYVTVSSSDMPAALASGQIDGFIHSEPTTSLAITKDHAQLALRIGGVVGDDAADVLVAKAAYLKDHAEAARKVVAALKDASSKFSTMEESKIVKIYTDYIKSTPELMKAVYHQKTIDPELISLRRAAEAFWQVDIPPLVKQGLVSPKLKESDLFDFSFGG